MEEEQIANSIKKQIRSRHNIESRIYDLTDTTFKYERFDEAGKPRMYIVPYKIVNETVVIDWDKEKLVLPPSFSHPGGDAKIDIVPE